MGARSPAHGSARGAIATSLARLALFAALVSRLGTPAQAEGGPFYTRASVGLPMPPLHLVQVPGISPDRYLAFGLSRDGVVIDVLPEQAGAAPDIAVTPYTLPDNFWCSVHGFDLDGNILVVSGAPGAGVDGYRRFDRESLNVTEITYNGDGRWYAGMTTMPSGYVAIWGGTGSSNRVEQDYQGRRSFYVLWNPALPSSTNTPVHFAPEMSRRLWTTDNQGTLFYYPMTFITPLDGRVLMWANDVGAILVAEGPNAGAVVAMLPPLPDPLLRTEFPTTGSVQMLPIGPEDGYSSMTFVVAGGSTYGAGSFTPAHSNVYTLTVTRDPATRAYGFSEWTVEPIAAALRPAPLQKVLGYVTPLPNGKLVFSGGGQSGIAGDGKANRPNYDAYLYTPWAPAGERFSYLGTTPIARMYHSVVVLGASGRLLATGTTDPRWREGGKVVEFMTPPDLTRELRVGAAVPSEARHGALVRINYACPNGSTCASAPAVTGAMLMAPASATHDMHAVQRAVRLSVVWARRDLGAVAVRLPPNSFVAVAGYYKVFLLAGERYTNAAWVRILPPAGFSPPANPAPPPRLAVTGAARLPLGPVLLQSGKSTTAALAAGSACVRSGPNAQVILEPANRTEPRHYWTYDAATQLLRSEYCGLCVLPTPGAGVGQLQLVRAFALALAPCDAAAAMQRWVWREEVQTFVSAAMPARCLGVPYAPGPPKTSGPAFAIRCAAVADTQWVHWPAPGPGADGGAAAPRVLLRSPVSRVTSPPMCLGQPPGSESQLGLVGCAPGDATQAFLFDQANGTLVAAASGLALAAASAEDGGLLGLAPPDGSELQRWEADASPLMALRPVARPDGCVEVRGGANGVATPAELRPCRFGNDSNRLQQVWQPVPLPSPPSTDPVALQLVQPAEAPPLCVTVPAGSADVVLWPCVPRARNQTYYLNRAVGLIVPFPTSARRGLVLQPGSGGGAARVVVSGGTGASVAVFWLFDSQGSTIRPKTSPSQCWQAAGATGGASIEVAGCGPTRSPDGRRGQVWRTVANPLAS